MTEYYIYLTWLQDTWYAELRERTDIRDKVVDRSESNSGPRLRFISRDIYGMTLASFRCFDTWKDKMGDSLKIEVDCRK